MICTDMLGILPLPYMIYPFSFFLFRGLDTELGIIPYIYTQYMSKVYPCCFRLQRFLSHCLTLAHTMYRRTEVCIADGFCVGFPISKWSTPGPYTWGMGRGYGPCFHRFFFGFSPVLSPRNEVQVVFFFGYRSPAAHSYDLTLPLTLARSGG